MTNVRKHEIDVNITNSFQRCVICVSFTADITVIAFPLCHSSFMSIKSVWPFLSSRLSTISIYVVFHSPHIDVAQVNPRYNL